MEQRIKPHVVTQWQKDDYRSPRTPGLHKSSSSYLRPDAHPVPQQTQQSRSPRILAPSPIEGWDDDCFRYTRDYSEPETPTSSVESTFEMPSEDVLESPNSSTHSYYLAELEDTSSPLPTRHPNPHEYRNINTNTPKPRRIRRPTIGKEPRYPSSPIKTLPTPTPTPTPPATMEFRTAQMTSRAVIKVIDETIAAIEDTNRLLLSRALAAEEIAQMMQERNLELEFKIKHYSQSRRQRQRPKTAPSLPRQREEATPISTFNDGLMRAPRSQRQTKSQLPPPRAQDFAAAIPVSRIERYDNAQFSQSPSQTPFQTSSRTYTNSLHPPSTSLHPPITAHQPPHANAHTHTFHSLPSRSKPGALSLAEALAKPLPPLGPMSPSVLRGVVEIGTSRNEMFGREDRVGMEKRKRGLSGLFGWRKKEGNEGRKGDGNEGFF